MTTNSLTVKSLPKFLLLLLLPRHLSAATSKIPLYIGNSAEDNKGQKILIYPDIISNRTIISSRDFNCSQTTGCELLVGEHTTTIGGHVVAYKDALVAMNVIEKPFEQSFKVLYLENDPYNFGSSVGLRQNSTFLNYLYDQDMKAGYSIAFTLDTRNQLNFIYTRPDFQGFKVGNEMMATIIFPDGRASLPLPQQKICFTNKLDRNSREVFLGVTPAQLQNWNNLITNGVTLVTHNGTSVSMPPIRFQLYDAKPSLKGEVYLHYRELMQDGVPLVTSFDSLFDMGRNCDIYTGTLLLRKYNFTYVYQEFDAGYDVGLNMNLIKLTNDEFVDEEDPAEPARSTSKMGIFVYVLIIVGVGVVIYLIYKHFKAGHQGDLYQNIEHTNIQGLEMRPTGEPPRDEQLVVGQTQLKR